MSAPAIFSHQHRAPTCQSSNGHAGAWPDRAPALILTSRASHKYSLSLITETRAVFSGRHNHSSGTSPPLAAALATTKSPEPAASSLASLPAGSFFGGFRTTAPVPAASPRRPSSETLHKTRSHLGHLMSASLIGRWGQAPSDY